MLNRLARWLREWSERLDGWETAIYDADLDVWNWPHFRREIKAVEEERDAYLKAYAFLYVEAQEKAPHRLRTKPPEWEHDPYLAAKIRAAIDGEKRKRAEIGREESAGTGRRWYETRGLREAINYAESCGRVPPTFGSSVRMEPVGLGSYRYTFGCAERGCGETGALEAPNLGEAAEYLESECGGEMRKAEGGYFGCWLCKDHAS